MSLNPNELKGEELFSYLRKNKEELIQQKKAGVKFCEAVTLPVIIREVKKEIHKAEESSEIDKDTLEVTVVANVANLVDSHLDMLTDSSYEESISKRGNSIPHLLDHNQSAVGHVGDVQKVYTQSMSLKDLGLDATGVTTALLMDSIVRKDYNEKAFQFYKNGKINQHSIGLKYEDIKFAMNSSVEGDEKEKAVWDEYYPRVINKEAVDKRGYFWVVSKVDIRENSAVLFGANPLTPTLSVKSEGLALPEDSSLNQPSIGKNMTLEEAQGKIISLTEELAAAKSAITVARLEAAKTEKDRVLNILKAQATFGTEAQLQKAALTAVEKGIDLDMAVVTFEMIKEGIQSANAVDTSTAGLTVSQIEERQSETAKDFFLRTAAAATTNNESIRSML